MNLSEILPSVRQLSTSEKLKLIRLIAEELETAEDIAPLEPFKTYDLPTPYNTLEKESKNIDLNAVHQICDLESGHFLVLATGWDKQRWLDIILFHARLADNKVFIAEDNFEEGLTHSLIAAGIKAEDIISEARSLYGNAS